MKPYTNAHHIRCVLILVKIIHERLTQLYTIGSTPANVQFDFGIRSYQNGLFGPTGFPLSRYKTDRTDRDKCIEKIRLGDVLLCGYLRITHYSPFMSVGIAGSVSGQQDSDAILHAVLLVVAKKCGWLSEEELRQNAKDHDCEIFYDKLIAQNYDDWKT